MPPYVFLRGAASLYTRSLNNRSSRNRLLETISRGTLLHTLNTGIKVRMGREQLIDLSGLLRSSLFLQGFQALERERHGPRILTGFLQELIAIIVGLVLLLLRVGHVHQRLAQVALLRIRQGRRLASLRGDAVFQGRSKQCGTETIFRITMRHMSDLMPDHSKQFLVGHDIH